MAALRLLGGGASADDKAPAACGVAALSMAGGSLALQASRCRKRLSEGRAGLGRGMLTGRSTGKGHLEGMPG